MIRTARIFALVAVLCFSTGCRDKAKEAKLARNAELLALMHGNTSDADIAAAMEKARATVDVFLAALKSPAPGQKEFFVRHEYPTAVPGRRQILIVNELRYDGKLLHGRLDDRTAQPGSGVARDGLVSFPPSEVCDWMFNDNGKATGGYMLRVLKTKMTEHEWKGYGEKIQFKDE